MKTTIELSQSEICDAVKAHLKARGYSVNSAVIRINVDKDDRSGFETTSCVAVANVELPPAVLATREVPT